MRADELNEKKKNVFNAPVFFLVYLFTGFSIGKKNKQNAQ